MKNGKWREWTLYFDSLYDDGSICTKGVYEKGNEDDEIVDVVEAAPALAEISRLTAENEELKASGREVQVQLNRIISEKANLINQLEATEKVYRMNREYVETSKAKLTAATSQLDEAREVITDMYRKTGVYERFQPHDHELKAYRERARQWLEKNGGKE